jgi:hypothetical protein
MVVIGVESGMTLVCPPELVITLVRGPFPAGGPAPFSGDGLSLILGRRQLRFLSAMEFAIP